MCEVYLYPLIWEEIPQFTLIELSFMPQFRLASPIYFRVSDLEDAFFRVFWKTAPSVPITHANVLHLAKAVADKTKVLSRFWIDSALHSPLCSLLYELSTKGHSESIWAWVCKNVNRR